MLAQAPSARPANSAAHSDTLDHLKHAIDHAAHLLPAQGPITVFIHHNTLHAFEDLPFTEAVEKAGKVFGCQPYLSEDRYREELRRGRIRQADLEAVLKEDLGSNADEPVFRNCTRFELRLAMLQYQLREGPTEELRWFVAETDALRTIRPETSSAIHERLLAETRRWVMRDLRPLDANKNGNGKLAGVTETIRRAADSQIENWSDQDWEACSLQLLWQLCCEAGKQLPFCISSELKLGRHRDVLLQASHVDADLLVHDVLIPFCNAFLDQGLAPWRLPEREQGFFHSFRTLYRTQVAAPEIWRLGLAAELDQAADAGFCPFTSIRHSLGELGVPENEWDRYLSATLLALRGWGGIIRFIEEHPDRVVRPIPANSFVEFVAVRLILDRLALAYLARETTGFTGPLHQLREHLGQQTEHELAPSTEQRAFFVFQLAQVLGWTPEELHRLTRREWLALFTEIETFSQLARRRVFHLAFERRFMVQSLDAVTVNWAHQQKQSRPRLQVTFCLDEREESIRRHLEEVMPEAETFGAAGFFGVAMYYRGAADAHFVPLCPIVLRPKNWVTEVVDPAAVESHQRRATFRRILGQLLHRFHLGSRTFFLGAILTVSMGVLMSIPIIARVLFPGLSGRFRRELSRFVQPPRDTHLCLERTEPVAGPEGNQLGFSLAEQIDLGERFLRDIGLTQEFARLVLVIGHGSSSQNNPHKSAYDCGACGGSPGAPNGRALARILNDPRVRAGMAVRKLVVPDETHFVGGIHNTCDDTIRLFDLHAVPVTHLEELNSVRTSLDEALARNAHERTRRFVSVPSTLTFEQAAEHVKNRSEDLAQTRPELGHATNALCIVGRRKRTRGLFLDRRAFLASYDPTQDDELCGTLTRLLSAALPVCSGINLEYYFSRVDNGGYGCGPKLPHNIAGLLGVMDGAASDLRTGLPWQMVEIHEPVRLLFIIETTPQKLLGIMERNPGLAKLIHNGWVRVATLDPNSANIQIFQNGAFHNYHPQSWELPHAGSSVEWYRGWRDHLEFAKIGPR